MQLSSGDVSNPTQLFCFDLYFYGYVIYLWCCEYSRFLTTTGKKTDVKNWMHLYTLIRKEDPLYQFFNNIVLHFHPVFPVGFELHSNLTRAISSLILFQWIYSIVFLCVYFILKVFQTNFTTWHTFRLSQPDRFWACCLSIKSTCSRVLKFNPFPIL